MMWKVYAEDCDDNSRRYLGKVLSGNTPNGALELYSDETQPWERLVAIPEDGEAN